MAIFKPQKIRDPRTGEERIVSPEEQELMLMKGAFFIFPIVENKSENKPEELSPPTPDA